MCNSTTWEWATHSQLSWYSENIYPYRNTQGQSTSKNWAIMCTVTFPTISFWLSYLTSSSNTMDMLLRTSRRRKWSDKLSSQHLEITPRNSALMRLLTTPTSASRSPYSEGQLKISSMIPKLATSLKSLPSGFVLLLYWNSTKLSVLSLWQEYCQTWLLLLISIWIFKRCKEYCINIIRYQ